MNVDWANIPIGAGVAALLIREVSRFLHERQQEKGDETTVRAVELESKVREIVYSELERHVLPKLNAINEKLASLHDICRELRWRKRNERTEDSG